MRRLGSAVFVVVAMAVACASWPSAAGADVGAGEDALVRRARQELAVFTTWLAQHGAKGYVGEVGWPDDRRGDGDEWAALAERWFQDADAAGLWVTAWATGEWWGDYALSPYDATRSWTGVDTAGRQAAVLEAHPTTSGRWRGVNVAGGEFASPTVAPTSTFSNLRRGVYDADYHYDSQATFTYLASRGVRLVRIPFRWERIQPVRGQSLDAAELQRLRAAVARAGAAGLRVVLDLHNYGGYYQDVAGVGVRRVLGTDKLPTTQFAELWGRISKAFQSNPVVLGYGLMNEPAEMVAVAGLTPAKVWEKASQAAVSRIRSNLDKKHVLVAGYGWSGAQRWTSMHAVPWIVDGAKATVYEAHHYWDRDSSGTYARSYADEVADAAARGY